MELVELLSKGMQIFINPCYVMYIAPYLPDATAEVSGSYIYFSKDNRVLVDQKPAQVRIQIKRAYEHAYRP